jgi:UDP-GlcNAc:undecaprenyl-phosphate GlcNAc-1-phosphate transferase
MNYELYLLPFLLALAISLVITLFLMLFAKGSDLRKGIRHIHHKNISRFGGFAMIMAFVAAILLDKNLVITEPMKGIFWAVFIILLIGVWDDLKELKWKTQLFFQLCVIAVVFYFGVRLEYVTNPFGGIILFDSTAKIFMGMLLTGGWILLLMNSMNWVDGVDGVSGGIAFIGVLTIFLLSLKPEVNQPPVAIIAIALTGSIFGFLFLNFNPARILAGTSGSMFLGFMLAVLSIFAGAKIATTLLVMVVPIVDAFWVMFVRVKSGQSIFSADRQHLHHKLMEKGWSQKQICVLYYLITSVVASLALLTQSVTKALVIVLVISLLMAGSFFVRRLDPQYLN